MKTAALALFAASGLALAPAALGQKKPAPRPAYQVEFFLTSQKGSAAAATHTYTLLLRASGNFAQIQTGDKIPIPTGREQFAYHSIGVDLNCQISQQPAPAGEVPLNVRANITAVASKQAVSDPGPPTISTVSTHIQTQVPLSRKETIASFEDATTQTHYQLAVIVKPEM